MSDIPTSRRRFLGRTLVFAIAAPLLGEATRAWAAAPLPKLPPGNPQAKALKYIEDASKSKEPSRKAGSLCKNCQFFTPATGACTLFAGFSVAPAGWCAAWAKKA